LSLITLVGIVVYITLLFTLLPTAGLAGAVVAFVAARAIIVIMTWTAASHLVAMPWFLKKQGL